MDTVNLRTFVFLTRLKNFTRTAEALYVAQSTVTNRIAELEKELGKDLFVRERKRVELTEEGRRFLGYAEQMLALEASAVRELHAAAFYHHKLRIGTTNTVYECHLHKGISEFLRSQADTAVQVTIGHSAELLRMLQEGILDMVFSYVPLCKKGYQCTLFHADELLLVTSAQNDAYRRGIRRVDLSELYYLFCNFALQEVGLFIRALFPTYYQFPFEIDNSTKLPQYLLEGAGYTFLPRSLVETHLKSGALLAIPLLDFDPPKISSYCISREKQALCAVFLHCARRFV